MISCKKEIPNIVTPTPQTKIVDTVVQTTPKFNGYKVAENAKILGKEYWENTSVLSDLMVAVYQKIMKYLIHIEHIVFFLLPFVMVILITMVI